MLTVIFDSLSLYWLPSLWFSSLILFKNLTISSPCYPNHSSTNPPIHHPTNWPDRPSIRAQLTNTILALQLSFSLSPWSWPLNSDLALSRSVSILGVHVRTYRCLLHSFKWFSPPGSWRLWGLFAYHCCSCGYCGAECADSSWLLGTH